MNQAALQNPVILTILKADKPSSTYIEIRLKQPLERALWMMHGYKTWQIMNNMFMLSIDFHCTQVIATF